MEGRSIVIESDSKVAVSWVLEEYGNLALFDVIAEVRLMLRICRNISVCYASRFSNVLADGLAKRGSLMDGESIVWNVF